MKVRNGFVSNSSSSSFLVCGARMDLEDYIKFFDIDETEAESIKEDIYNYFPDERDGFDIVVDTDSEQFIVGEQMANGDGWYGAESFDMAAFTEAFKSENVKKLKAAGWNCRVWIGQFGDG